MPELYIGLMSGTSVDGIDAVLVDLSKPIPELLATHQHALADDVRHLALTLALPQDNEIHLLNELDQRLGHAFADAALALLKKANVNAKDIQAIGSHGQTIRHQPNNQFPYTLQIGDPNIIAAYTGITTVADFRRRDIANGGQGAPFAPIFHAHVLADQNENRAVINIGGIANITVLEKGNTEPLLGFDTGPGNGLMDSWIQLHLNERFDSSGAWAAQGKIIPELLGQLLAHPYFQLSAPKSTGRDHFSLAWLQEILHAQPHAHEPVDIQTTLAELTAQTIAQAITAAPIKIERIILCGGGAHNMYLFYRIHNLSALPTQISDEFGISADWQEAELFAWLAQQTLHKRVLNLSKITGAQHPAILGGVYWA